MAGTNQRLFEVDHAALCALVRRASLAQPVDRALPTFFVEWRSRLFSEAVELDPTPGELARAALGAATDRVKSRELVLTDLRAGRIGPWPPATAWVAERMERAQKSLDELEGDARSQAIEAWLAAVTRELADATDGRELADQLAEWAWVEWQREDLDRARALLAVSDELAGSPDGSAMEPEAVEGQRALARARVEAVFGPFLDRLNNDSVNKNDTLNKKGSEVR
jgi:hypothetical protein